MPGKGLPASAFGAGGSPQTVMLKYGAGVSSTVGGAAVAVPGRLRGWDCLLQRHGRLDLSETLAPAVRLAREGFSLCKTSGLWFEVAEEVLRLTDETRKNFYNGDRVFQEGEEVRFPELADTLEAVGEGGAALFYEGELGRRISAYMLGIGGIITEQDLAEYQAVVRRPLTVAYGPGRSTPTARRRQGARRWPRCSRSSPPTTWRRARGGLREGHGRRHGTAPSRPRGRLRRGRRERAVVATPDQRGIRQRAAASDLRPASAVRRTPHISLRGRRGPRHLLNRDHGLRLGARHPRHRHPDEQHPGRARAQPQRVSTRSSPGSA